MGAVEGYLEEVLVAHVCVDELTAERQLLTVSNKHAKTVCGTLTARITLARCCSAMGRVVRSGGAGCAVFELYHCNRNG